MKAFRLGAGLTPEELAVKAGISRAAIYRYESGQPARIDTLVKIATLLGVSLPTLLGAGVEYMSSSVSFFERMRQLEENVEQISVLFGPISYLLTTDLYDKYLELVLKESIPDSIGNRANALQDADTLIEILHARKSSYRRRLPGIISLMSAAELSQFVRIGFIGAYNPPNVDIEKRKEVARAEIENMVHILRNPPIGVQLGVVVDSMPGASLQLFRQGDKMSVGVSPFRLGELANFRLGVATISAAPDAIKLYREMTNQLWLRSLKGEQAAEFIEQNVLQ